MRLARRGGLLFVLVALAAYTTSGWWLAGLGNFLILSEEPVKADLAVVLGGDWNGLRILKAGDLVRSGFVPKALISGPPQHYDVPECDLAIDFATRRGYPEAYFERWPNTATSTRDEAEQLRGVIAGRGTKRILLVTSDYHTRRAARIFRKALPELDIRVIASADKYYRADSWWRSREGAKTFVMEWAKTVTSPFGL